jgi:hypothetical protein
MYGIGVALETQGSRLFSGHWPGHFTLKAVEMPQKRAIYYYSIMRVCQVQIVPPKLQRIIRS